MNFEFEIEFEEYKNFNPCCSGEIDYYEQQESLLASDPNIEDLNPPCEDDLLMNPAFRDYFFGIEQRCI